MKVLNFKRLSILSLVLLAASAATAFIAKDKKVDQRGHITDAAADTSTAYTCRTPVGQDVLDCNDTTANASSSAGVEATTEAPENGATSSDLGQNTTVGD